MTASYSPGIADLIDERWAGYDYDRQDVVDMVALLVRPPSHKDTPITDQERLQAEEILAACD